MYYYQFRLTPSQPKSEIDYTNYKDEIIDSVNSVNAGIAFKRDGKEIVLSSNDIEQQAIILSLNCKTPLEHAARSLSALTRYLTTNYNDIFSQYVFNKTLFHMDLISQSSSFDELEISDTDLLKGVIDLLFTHTTTTKKEAILREETITQIKELVRPYIKK